MTTVYWDLTTRCNARCLYCSAWQDRAAGRDVAPSPGFARTVLAGLRAAGTTRVVMLGGEPTLIPHLPGIIADAVRLGMRVGLATNGIDHDTRLRAALLDRPEVSITISLDSYFADENDAVRGSGYHAHSLAALQALLAGRRANGAHSPGIWVQATLTRANLARLEESLTRLADLDVDGILLDRMRSFAWQPPAVRALAPRPAEWIAGAVRLARAARHAGPGRMLLNYGHARLRGALAARFDIALPAERSCPAGLQTAVLDIAGVLHPCRLARARPVPVRADGRPWYERQTLRAGRPEAAAFLDAPYFVGFFNFAHSASIYEPLALCRDCPHAPDCEPCPLDVVTRGDAVLAECRHLIEEGLPDDDD